MESPQSWEETGAFGASDGSSYLPGLGTYWCHGMNLVRQKNGPTTSSSRFWIARLSMNATASPSLFEFRVLVTRHSTSAAANGSLSRLCSSAPVIRHTPPPMKSVSVFPFGISTSL